MLRSGAPFVHVIEFASGSPDANLSWTLTDATGDQLVAGTVTPGAGALSVTVVVAGIHNTLQPGALFAPRNLAWAYTVGGQGVADGVTYSVEAVVPFGVSADGVRRKLGLEAHELIDRDIDLLRGYTDVGDTIDLSELAGETGRTALLARDAIEAQTALNLLPTLQVRLAQKEVGGEKQFQRAKIDYALLTVALLDQVAALHAAVDTSFDGTPGGTYFTLAGRTADPLTGA